jgi:hypothetical protein
MKTIKRMLLKTRRGSILAFVLVIGMCLALLGWGMLQMGFGGRLNAVIANSVIDARTAADAGMDRALYAMNLNYKYPATYSFPTSEGPISLGSTNYNYTVTAISGTKYQIDSTGNSARQTRNTHAISVMTSSFDYALFVTQNIDMGNTSSIDGYNSLNGPYGTGNSGLPVLVGSNTTTQPTGSGGTTGIVIKNADEIKGNLLIGPGGDPGIVVDPPNGGDVVTGYTSASKEAYQWAKITLPSSYESKVSKISFSGTQSIGTGGTYINAQTIECDTLDLGTNNILEIIGDVRIHVTKKVSLQGSNNEIRITNGSSLKIYLDGTFDSGNTTLFNVVTQDPKRFILYGTGSETNWDIKYGDKFYGVIYAPNAHLRIYNSGDIYGAVAGLSCILFNSGQLHYDLALADPINFPAGYVINRWWED